MRVNIYAEETTPLVEIIEKTNESGTFTGLRFWLHLPATMPDGTQFKGPFMHHADDDDSSAVTFWGKHDMRANFQEALRLLDAHYEEVSLRHPPAPGCNVNHDDYVGHCPGCHSTLPSIEDRKLEIDRRFGQPHHGHGPDVA